MKLVSVELANKSLFSQDYEKVRKEGSSKGIELPYKDEAVQIVEQLGNGDSLADKAIYYLGSSEKSRLNALGHLGITGPRADYLDILVMILAAEIAREEEDRLKKRLAFVRKLLK